MLPFLKNKQEASASDLVDEKKVRKSDETDEPEFEMLDAIVEDILEGVIQKDKKRLKMALEALIEHIQFEDEIQDDLEDNQ